MPQKSLLIAIAKHESRRDKVCRASIPSLAADMGSDVKTVRFAMHGLGKILRIKNVPGLASRIVIDWKRFAKLPCITPTESGRGVSRRGPLPKVVGVPLPNLVGVTPPESGTTQRVKNQGSGIDSGAARIDRVKYLDGCPSHAAENSVQPSISFKELAAKKKHPAPSWAKGELAEDLYRGIHHQKIANTFFDARHLSPREQLLTCITVAVTSLVTCRVARLKVLNAAEIEARAFQELLGGLEALASVRNFEMRRQQTTRAVTRVVVEQCVRMLDQEKQVKA